jgi:hypothetical protein
MGGEGDMSKDTLIPAFPLPSTVSNGQVYDCEQYGMSLRDYFAAKAMQAWISSDCSMDKQTTRECISECSYAMADAMLEAREK